MTFREGSSSRPGLQINVNSLVKTYGTYKALDGVDLDIAAGEFLTLLGPSGSGKSTLLMVIAGFIRPTSGSLSFGGKDVTMLEPHKRNIGVVFQNYALFPHMTVGANVAYPLKLRGVSKPKIREQVAWALSLVKLDGYDDRSIDQLSGGQRQRVALARAVVFEPDVLLMDEPLSALDKKLREHMQIEIRRLHETLGVTTIYVTHDQREALTMSDRIAVINHGRFEQIAQPRTLYETPGSSFVADFIGDATVIALQGDASGRTLNGHPVRSNGHAVPVGEAFLVMRPEKLRILDGSSDDQWNRFAGVVSDSVYQGESVLISVTLENGESVFLRQPTDQQTLAALPQRGQPIEVGLHIRDTLIVPRHAAT
ncbi:putative spermidine/putrescine transport system ATP-binding protein [Rhodoligotrophos appendicifer]|uniref:ABC transporter ATP-binding protein n=1 Tax=Rhodoligotrophos appendicifer TaxID=987056 RepID=UPI001186B598|nr:ABC transporter ATP-binding protein [Rhodoligotrophos appendicifer]